MVASFDHYAAGRLVRAGEIININLPVDLAAYLAAQWAYHEPEKVVL
jgi:hypothetical protein